MDQVQCTCKKCGASIGEFINLWTQIGNKHFSPVVVSNSPVRVGHKGLSRLGDSNTLVQGW